MTNILNSTWIKTAAGKVIGFVAVDCGPREENWQCYMAALPNARIDNDFESIWQRLDPDDELEVIQNGSQFNNAHVAALLFPDLEAEGYL